MKGVDFLPLTAMNAKRLVGGTFHGVLAASHRSDLQKGKKGWKKRR